MFAGSIVNPIADARISASYSLNRLANKLSVSKQYISRAEHGTYTSLNQELIKWAANTLDIPRKDVVYRYKVFQTATRSRSALEINPPVLERRSSARPGNVLFTVWREGYWPSITAFSNSFCVHPEMIRAYEDGIRDEMPELLRKVLTDVGLIDKDWTENASSVKASGVAVGRRASLLALVPDQRSH